MKIHSAASYTLKSRAGFSLTEMLVVIAILGVLASIAIASFTQGNRDVIVESVHRRNAQAFATISQCAQAGGVDPVVGTDVIATLNNIANGVTPVMGPMAGNKFRMSGLSAEDVTGAAYYLHITNGQLVYEADKPILISH